jgi:hypothetical protein
MEKKTNNKRHAPTKQLKKAAKIANDRLKELGIITGESSIEKIKKDFPHVKLPGIFPYLPHKWTLRQSQRVMYDLFRMWQYKNTEDKVLDEKTSENFIKFFEFAIKELEFIEKRAKDEMKEKKLQISDTSEVILLQQVFAPVNLYETTKAIKKFFIDGFAEAIIVNGKNSSTGEFAEWFFQWTDDMYAIWEQSEDKKVDDIQIEKAA